MEIGVDDNCTNIDKTDRPAYQIDEIQLYIITAQMAKMIIGRKLVLGNEK